MSATASNVTTMNETRTSVSVADPAGKGDMTKIMSMLTDLQNRKDRELTELQREIQERVIKAQMLERELQVIDAKKRAIRVAIRSLEDSGVA